MCSLLHVFFLRFVSVSTAVALGGQLFVIFSVAIVACYETLFVVLVVR